MTDAIAVAPERGAPHLETTAARAERLIDQPMRVAAEIAGEPQVLRMRVQQPG